MSRPPRPQFLARDSYRMRRLMDAAKFLPLFGFVLLLLPLMRHSPDVEAPPTASEMVYLFLVWFGLILLALLMSLGLRRVLSAPPQKSDPSPLSED